MSRSDLTCDVSSSSVSAGQSLPSKIYDCQSKVVLIQDLLQAGVAEIQGGDGRLVYCFFQVMTTSNWFTPLDTVLCLVDNNFLTA